MQGRRLPDGWHSQDSEPGDYWKTPDGRWEICDPVGVLGSIGNHEVEEHEDGTITVTPSIYDAPDGWHGFLIKGIWSEA